MSIYDPYGLYPNISTQDMTVLSSEGINIVWGDNPAFSPSDFLNYFPEFTNLIEDGSISVKTYFDTDTMIADQANQTIGYIYEVESVLYKLNVKNGLITGYTVSPAASPYNALFSIYSVLASSELSEKRFTDVWKYVMSLYIAHKLTVRFGTLINVENLTDASKIARKLATVNQFIASSESVGGVSVSYDVGATLAMGANAGDWNRTQYGQELATMVKNYGAISVWISGI